MPTAPPADEDGSQLWLRYPKVPIPGRLAEYQAGLTHIVKAGTSATLQAAQAELVKGSSGLTGTTVPVADAADGRRAPWCSGRRPPRRSSAGCRSGSRLTAVAAKAIWSRRRTVGGKAAIVVAANTDVGVLHGAFALLRHLQCHRTLAGPGAQRARPRSSAASSITGTTSTAPSSAATPASRSGTGARCRRRSRSATPTTRAPTRRIGINGAVLNNVNAERPDPHRREPGQGRRAWRRVPPLRHRRLPVGALQRAHRDRRSHHGRSRRPRGARPGGGTRSDEIYATIPDFGGFLVKANSEGQPGPQDYRRTHADGANMLADALAPHGGIVMWRAFVYATTAPIASARRTTSSSRSTASSAPTRWCR